MAAPRRAALLLLALLAAAGSQAALAPTKVVLKKNAAAGRRDGAAWSRAGLSAASSSAKLAQEAVADWALYNVGGPLLSSASTANAERPFPARDLNGGKRQANALFVLSNADRKDLSAAVGGAAAEKNFASLSYPAASRTEDSVATAASLARGIPASEHGVVARSFPLSHARGVAHAFLEGAWPAHPTAADALLGNTESAEVTTISASFDFPLAAAFAANPRTAAAHNGAASALFWDEEKDVAAAIYGAESAKLPLRSEVLARAAKDSRFNAAADAGDFALFAELELLRASTKLAVAGGRSSQSLLFFTFSSLERVSAAKRAAALELVAAAVRESLSALDGAFGEGKVDAQVLATGVAAPAISFDSLSKPETQDFYAGSSPDESRKYFMRFFPMFYADASGDSRQLCASMKAAVATSDKFAVECAPMGPEELAQVAAADSGEVVPELTYTIQRRANTSTGGLLGPGEEDAKMANIILWMAIALALTIYYAVYAIYNMDVGTDDLIYRLTDIRDKVKLDNL
jgi:Renin receptor-like protein